MPGPICQDPVGLTQDLREDRLLRLDESGERPLTVTVPCEEPVPGAVHGHTPRLGDDGPAVPGRGEHHPERGVGDLIDPHEGAAVQGELHGELAGLVRLDRDYLVVLHRERDGVRDQRHGDAEDGDARAPAAEVQTQRDLRSMDRRGGVDVGHRPADLDRQGVEGVRRLVARLPLDVVDLACLGHPRRKWDVFPVAPRVDVGEFFGDRRRRVLRTGCGLRGSGHSLPRLVLGCRRRRRISRFLRCGRGLLGLETHQISHEAVDLLHGLVDREELEQALHVDQDGQGVTGADGSLGVREAVAQSQDLVRLAPDRGAAGQQRPSGDLHEEEAELHGRIREHVGPALSAVLTVVLEEDVLPGVLDPLFPQTVRHVVVEVRGEHLEEGSGHEVDALCLHCVSPVLPGRPRGSELPSSSSHRAGTPGDGTDGRTPLPRCTRALTGRSRSPDASRCTRRTPSRYRRRRRGSAASG